MNKIFELRWFAENMNYLTNSERRQTQQYFDNILEGCSQFSLPHTRRLPRRAR